MATVSARPRRAQQPDPARGVSPGLRIRGVPESRPPGVVWAGRSLPPKNQRMLALDLAELQPEPAKDTLVRDVRSWSPQPSRQLPDAYAWSLSLTQAIIEALQGRRPTNQLTRWVDERVLADINLTVHARSFPAAQQGPTLIRSVRVQFPRDQVIEVAVHLTRDGRSSAMAMRLDARDRRWLCTALELGPRPAPAFSDPVSETKRSGSKRAEPRRRTRKRAAGEP